MIMTKEHLPYLKDRRLVVVVVVVVVV